MGSDKILNWTPPEVFQKYWPGGIVEGIKDKDGGLLVINPQGLTKNNLGLME